MSTTAVVYFVTREADLPAGALPAGAVVRPADEDGDIPAGASVWLVRPGQARRLLERRPDAASLRIVLWRAPDEAIDAGLLDHPRVTAVVDASSARETVYAALRQAAIRSGTSPADEAVMNRLLEIGRALASEKDLDVLLERILTHARQLTGADGASIYTRDRQGKLYFRLWQNASTKIRATAQKTLVGDYSIAGYVARSGEQVVLEDAYRIPEEAPYRFNPASDRSIDYHTQSMLTLPLTNKAGEVVGVLQLINKKDAAEAVLRTERDCREHVLPFDEHSIGVAQALAGQAGVALENSILYADIERLFEGFIKASVQAIEARDPTTAGHSFRVAEFTERLARAVDRTDVHGLKALSFTKEQMKELRYAALLHDFGKVGVRENVLVKSKKLYPHQLDLLKQRFHLARTSLERNAYREMLRLMNEGEKSPAARRRLRDLEAALARDIRKLEHFLDIILRANEPTISHQEIAAELGDVASFTFPGENGEEIRLLNDFEFTDLTLSKGSLNRNERVEIESHVSHTFAFLSLIPWTKNLARLPEIAYGHHEKIDGSGYPRGLRQDEIPVQSRMMTIADIYDALTAGDRPYKRALPVDKALDILAAEAKAGKIEQRLFRVFVDSRAYELIPH